MFTGIVEQLGQVVAVEHAQESAVLRVGGSVVTQRRDPGCLDRGQRRLPDGHRPPPTERSAST